MDLISFCLRKRGDVKMSEDSKRLLLECECRKA